MDSGYLLIETRAGDPGVIRIRTSDRAPPAAAPDLRFAARFDDRDAALMHLHQALRRGLLDVDQGLYRADLLTAVAAADASMLRHQRTYLDPALAGDPALDAAIASRQRRWRRLDALWTGIGLLAVAWLVAMLLASGRIGG